MIDQRAFDSNVDPRLINAGLVVQRYLARFGGEPLTGSMRAVYEDAATKEWREIRNVLAHRASPGRGLYLGENWADWMEGVLSGDAIRERRSWIGVSVTSLLAPAVAFVHERLP